MGQNQSVPITPPQQTADQAVGGLVPMPAPPPDRGLDQTVQAIAGAWQTPGATVPFMATPAPIARPPAQPQMVPMQPMTPTPTGQGATVYDHKIANAQRWGQVIGNSLGMIANKKLEQEYNNRVTTIEDYSKEYIRRDKAMRYLALYPNDPAALKVKSDAETAMQNMEKDPKQSKMLKDAYPNYVDPTKDKHKEERNKGMGNASKAASGGTLGDSPEEQQFLNKADATEKMLNQSGGKPQQTAPFGPPPVQQQPNTPSQPGQQGITPGGLSNATGGQMARPSPAQPGVLNRRGANTPTEGIPQGASVAAQKEAGKAADRQAPYGPRFKFPTELESTPEYTAAMGQQQEYIKNYLTKILPEVEKQAAELYKEQVKQGNQNFRQIQRDVTSIGNKYMEWVTRANIGDARNKMELQKQAIASAGGIQQAQIRAGMFTTALLSDPRFAPFAGVYSEKLIGQNNKQIDGLMQANRVTGQQIADLKASLGNDPLHPGHKIPPNTPERQRIEEQIRRLNTGMEINMDQIGRLQQLNEQISTAAAGATQGKSLQGGGAQAGGGQASASGLDTSGDYQRWFPLISQVIEQNPQFKNIPGPLIQTMLMMENRTGDPNANPQPGNASKGTLQGGQGLFQLIPSNQKKYGVSDPYNAESNTRGALSMLSSSLAKNGGDVRKAIEDYAPKSKGLPDKAYVDKAMGIYQQLTGARGGGTSGAATNNTTGQTSSGGAVVPTGAEAVARGKQSAATATGEQVALGHQAIRDAFGIDLYAPITSPVLPTTQYADEGGSTSSSDTTEEDAADDAANATPP